MNKTFKQGLPIIDSDIEVYFEEGKTSEVKFLNQIKINSWKHLKYPLLLNTIVSFILFFTICFSTKDIFVSSISSIIVFIAGYLVIIISTLLETPRAQEFYEKLVSKNKYIRKFFMEEENFTVFKNPINHIEMKMPKAWDGIIDIRFSGDCEEKRQKMSLYHKGWNKYILEIFLKEQSIDGEVKVCAKHWR